MFGFLETEMKIVDKTILTDKQKMFVQEYLIDLNATQAAIRAGYSENCAGEQGYENLKKHEIIKAIEKAQEKRIQRILITQDQVLKDLIEVKNRCLQQESVKDKDGNETGEYVFKEQGVLKACELLGKHLKMFTDKIEQTNTGDVKITFASDKLKNI